MQRSTIIICFISFCLTALGGVGLYFALQMTSSARDEVHKLRAEEEDLNKKNQSTTRLSRLDKKVEGLVSDADAEALDVSDEGIISFLGEIESDARIAGVKLDVNNPDIAPDRSRLRMQVAVSGGFEEVHHFIAIIERLPYLIDLNSVAVGQQVGAAGANNYSATLAFSVLSVKKSQ